MRAVEKGIYRDRQKKVIEKNRSSSAQKNRSPLFFTPLLLHLSQRVSIDRNQLQSTPTIKQRGLEMASTHYSSSVTPSTSSPRRSVDEEEERDEESAGLLSDYQEYPPPPSPPSLSSPFTSKSSNSTRRRISLLISLLVFFAVVLASTLHQFSQLASTPREPTLKDYFHDPPGDGESLDRDLFIEEEAKLLKDYTVTAIVLHGLGQDTFETPFVRRMKDQFPYVRW